MAIAQSALMVDPSILLSQRGLQWLESDSQDRNAIVISAAFYNVLANPTESLFLRRLSKSADGILTLQRLRGLLDGVQRFDGTDVQLPDSIEAIRATLRFQRGYDNRIFADEWAYLHSQSWMIARTERALKAFLRAGAGVLQFGRRLRSEFINVVVPQQAMPRIISHQFLAVVGAKWLVVAGAAATGGALGGVGGGLLGLPAVPIVRAFDA
jgi:hypothetical protein